MFWEVELSKKVCVQPSDLSQGIRKTVENELAHGANESQIQSNSIILFVEKILDILPGNISSRSGYCTFEVKYKAVIFKPQEGQIINAIIDKVDNSIVSARAGPLNIYIDKLFLPLHYIYSEENQAYIDSSKPTEIFQKGTKIRVKLTTIRPSERQGILAIGNLKDLGTGFIP